MIINNKGLSLTEVSTLLGKTEIEVLTLCQHGYLEQCPHVNGRTRISMNSIEKYSRRNGISLQKVLVNTVERFSGITIQESMSRLGLSSEVNIHRLIQAGKLKAQMVDGIYKVDAKSVRNYVLGEGTR